MVLRQDQAYWLELRYDACMHQPSCANVALIGFMGVGKSAVGKCLAAELSWRHVDLDDLLTTRYGPIPEIFASVGETEFRVRERNALLEVLERHEQVLSCGGGVVRDELNRTSLRSRAFVVWLRADAAEIARRLVADGPGRPLIDQHADIGDIADVERRVACLLAEREPLYAQCAHAQLDVERLGISEVVDQLQALLP